MRLRAAWLLAAATISLSASPAFAQSAPVYQYLSYAILNGNSSPVPGTGLYGCVASTANPSPAPASPFQINQPFQNCSTGSTLSETQSLNGSEGQQSMTGSATQSASPGQVTASVTTGAFVNGSGANAESVAFYHQDGLKAVAGQSITLSLVVLSSITGQGLQSGVTVQLSSGVNNIDSNTVQTTLTAPFSPATIDLSPLLIASSGTFSISVTVFAIQNGGAGSDSVTVLLGCNPPLTGVSYVCDSSIYDNLTGDVCGTLNSTTAALYNNAFTNANACLYVQLGSSSLGETVSQPVLATYSNYRTALTAAESDANDTTAVAASVPATNPYGTDSVQLTNPLARALGASVLGVSTSTGILTDGKTPCSVGTVGCYDAILTISDSIPLFLRSGTIGASQYDFYTLVERQTDEALGTGSCSPGTSCTGKIDPADLFRYHSNGARSFAAGTNDPCSSSDSTNACFSLDGAHMLQQYNNLNNGEDTGDWVSSCASNPMVQDAAGCPGVANLDISPNTEILVLDVVGYNANLTSSVTIQTSPEGLQFNLDGGAAQAAPQTLHLSPGSHTIAVPSPQAGGAGAQYSFGSWSDGGAVSHAITTASNSAATYTATFNTQYQLTATASPAAGGTVTPASGTYYTAGTAVSVTAAPAAGYTFSGWTGPVANASAASTTVTMTGAENITANFSPMTGITIQTNPAGLQVSIDGGSPVAAPTTVTLSQGSHTIAVATTQAGAAGAQYVFASWSDGGAASHSITVASSSAAYTASFTTQYLLTTSVSPSGSGAVNASPSSSGYYNAGTAVQLTASPNSGYQLNNWSGDLSGATNPQSLVMNASHNVTANFSAVVTACSFTLSSSASLPATGTSTAETCPNNSGQPNCGVAPETQRSFTVTPTGGCGAWTATSSNPGFLQITSGVSGTGAGTVSYVLLNNTHTGRQTDTITVSSGASSATYTVTEAGSGDSEVYRQIYALYEQLLGRDPDAGGFAFWTGAGGAGLGQMADAFLTSPEAFNSDFAVMAAYQAATGSAPTYSQFTAAVTATRSGTQSVTGLFNSLVNAGYSATNLYQNLLARAPSAGEISQANNAGLASWFETLIGYPAAATPIGAANNEFQSTGSFHTDHANALYIEMLYYLILTRDVDQGGLNFWVGIANTGGPGILFQGSSAYLTRIQILGPGTPDQGFIGSAEFQGLFAN